MSKHSEFVFQNDRIRKKSDIRNKDKSELTWFQKSQLVLINRDYTYLEQIELKKKIFGTFDSRG